jgi:hypothetical protein
MDVIELTCWQAQHMLPVSLSSVVRCIKQVFLAMLQIHQKQQLHASKNMVPVTVNVVSCFAIATNPSTATVSICSRESQEQA